MLREIRVDVVMMRTLARAHMTISRWSIYTLFSVDQPRTSDDIILVIFEFIRIFGVFILVVLPRFHVVLQVPDRRVNRTTRPATLIVAWLVNLYIVCKRYLIGHSLLCYNHPPLKIHVIPLACNYFRYRLRRNLFGYRLVNHFVFAFKQLFCCMCYFTSQARKAVLTSCVLLSQLDNDRLE